MTLMAELEEFVTAHRPHGTWTADTGGLKPNGYRLEVACSCGVVVERCITPRDAGEDLAFLDRRPLLQPARDRGAVDQGGQRSHSLDTALV